MVTLPKLPDFAGTWVISRSIDDLRADQTGVLTGTATFEPGGHADGYIYREEGKLRMDGATEMEAHRVYLWSPHPRGIAVQFKDGRDFHVVELDRLMPDDQHHCAPDMYYVAYDFSNWPAWSSRWRVRGPKKDYRMVTEYRRG